jgi:tetratricopeptide (TPR) repeat protein
MLGFKTISYFLQNWNNGEIKFPSQMITRIRGILEDEFCGRLPTSQKDLLEFCLLINHKAISYEFLEFLEFLEPKDLELFFSDTIERFARHGLLETRLPRGQTVTCSISAVLYQYLRQSIKSWPDNLTTSTRILAHKVPRSSKDNHRASLEILAPHTELFAKYIINTPKMVNPPATYLDNMERIASLLRLLGHDGDAIKLYGYIHQQNKEPKTGKEARPGRLKLSHARTAELYNNMGLSCLNEGDVTFACSCFDKAIATLESGNLGNTNTMLEVVANVARANLDIEDYAAAERLLVDMLSKFQKKGQDSLLPLQLLPLQHFLGFARFKLGQTDQGIRNLEVSCETALKNPRAGKRLAYSIMHDLATAYREQKQFTRATNLYEKAREGRKSIHGPEHRYTIETTAALALSYHGSGQSDKAAVCFQKALKWQREHLRPNHPDTLQTLQNYGIFQSDVGNLEAAKKALHLAYTGHTLRDDNMGRVSWKRINSGVSLALVLQGLKSFYDSAGLFEEAVGWYKAHCPLTHTENSVETSKTMYQYCKTLYLQGRMYEEWGYLGEALKRYAEADKVSGIAGCEIDYWRQLARKRIDKLGVCVGFRSSSTSGTS